MEAQSFAVKRAEVEFHNFASFGEPERALGTYTAENQRRAAIARNHLSFIGPMTPFLEIGAAAGHSSYMFANEFGAQGFALDLSADALRYGRMLIDQWNLSRRPVLAAGDALRLPFRDGSLRMVCAFQMLSQFMDIEAVFLEVIRVLQPGGIFFLAEEPVRRLLSLRLYRAPYWEQMKPWERKLFEWGLLGYLTKDVIGAHQEESFGIRQNHRMKLDDWDRLIRKHFSAYEHEVFPVRRGWGETLMCDLARRFDRYHSDWVPARLLGGTLAAVCRKPGSSPEPWPESRRLEDEFERVLACPDCGGALDRDAAESLRCTTCAYQAPLEGGVYNLLRSEDRRELYPGLRQDIIDFSLGPCNDRLLSGFFEVEGVYGNKYRWIGESASFVLKPVRPGQTTLRIRGFAPEHIMHRGPAPRVEIAANGLNAGSFPIDRPGLFVIETRLAPAAEYRVDLSVSPCYQAPPDDRWFTVNLSNIRLVD